MAQERSEGTPRQLSLEANNQWASDWSGPEDADAVSEPTNDGIPSAEDEPGEDQSDGGIESEQDECEEARPAHEASMLGLSMSALKEEPRSEEHSADRPNETGRTADQDGQSRHFTPYEQQTNGSDDDEAQFEPVGAVKMEVEEKYGEEADTPPGHEEEDDLGNAEEDQWSSEEGDDGTDQTDPLDEGPAEKRPRHATPVEEEEGEAENGDANANDRTEIDELKAVIGGMSTQLEVAYEEIVELKAKMNEMSTENEELNASVCRINGMIGKMVSLLSGTKAQSGEIKEQMDEMQSKLAEISTENDKLKAAFGTIKAGISGMKAMFGEMKTERGGIKEEMCLIKAELAELSANNGKLIASVDGAVNAAVGGGEAMAKCLRVAADAAARMVAEASVAARVGQGGATEDGSPGKSRAQRGTDDRGATGPTTKWRQ